jgi:hypothetical protein
MTAHFILKPLMNFKSLVATNHFGSNPQGYVQSFFLHPIHLAPAVSYLISKNQILTKYLTILIAGAKEINRDRKHLVVERSAEYGEHRHEKVEETEFSDSGWSEEEADGKEEMDGAVAHVSEHYAKLDGECHDGEQRRIHFLISWYTIRLHQQLRRHRKIIQLEITRRRLLSPVLYLLKIALSKIGSCRG